MALLLFVTPEPQPATDAPAALQLLNHTITRLTETEALNGRAGGDLAIVDARAKLAEARTIAQELFAQQPSLPVLLMINSSALSVLSPDWGIGDFILEDATPAEFDTRIRLLLTKQSESNTIAGGSILIDEDAYIATVNGHPLNLTYTEFELLKCMVLHPDHVLTREFLLSEVWGYDYYGGTRTVDVHIRRLRAKLGPEFDSAIGTVRNVGYRFSTTHQNFPNVNS